EACEACGIVLQHRVRMLGSVLPAKAGSLSLAHRLRAQPHRQLGTHQPLTRLKGDTRNLRPTDFGPRTNVTRGIEVRVGCILALLAGEPSLAAAIASSNMPTRRTLLTSMRGVHQDYGHTGQSCFVLNEAAELGERPAGHLCPLRLPE